MSTIQFFFRLFCAALVIGGGVLLWALVPFLQGVHNPAGEVQLSVDWLSVFFGTSQPAGYTVLLLLISRAALAMALASWIFVPAFSFFADADFSPLTRGIVLLFLSICVTAFFGALIVHWLVYS